MSESTNTSSVGTNMKPLRAESILEIAWRRKGLVVIVLFLTVMAAALALILIPKRYAAEAKVLVTINKPVNADAPGSDLKTVLNTQVEIIRSPVVLSTALEAPHVAGADFFVGTLQPINKLKENLEVEPVADASVLKIRIATTDREQSKLIVNAVSSSYVDHIKSQKQNTAMDAFGRLSASRTEKDTRRLELRKQLITLQGETRQFETPDGSGASMAVQRLRQLSDQVIKTQLASAEYKSKLEEALKPFGMTPDKVDESKLANATAVSAQSLELLQNNLAALNQQLIEAKRRFVPTHPAVRTVQAQIKDLQLSQAATLLAAFRESTNLERNQRELLLEQEKIVQNLGAKIAEAESLQGQLTVLDRDITMLDEKLSQLMLNESVGYSASELATAAIDENSVVPNTWRTLGVSAIVGLVLGLSLALVREWVSPSLGAVHRIAETVGVPVLGTLPRLIGKTGRQMARLTHDESDTPAAESFRSIRTSMLFGAGRCGTIAVTSPAPKDGKTTLAANVAISLAQSGKSVVLIDANFREPMLQDVFGMDNGIGFTGVMTGDDLESSLRRTEIEHLDVLTAGPKNADISEQLNSQQFVDLLRDLNLRYDHVIFDTSSVSGSNDARVIAASCDQTILVVRGERSNRFAATTARDALLSVGATLMGIVVNDSQSVAQAYPPAGERREQGPTQDRMSEIANRLRISR